MMRVMIVLAVLLLVVACQSPEDGGDAAQTHPGADLTIATGGDEVLEEALDAARTDLSEKLGVDPGAMIVQEMARVTWRDGAKGCPEPGMAYTQALVPGVLIRLIVDGTEYRYHGGEDGRVFACPQERAGSPVEDRAQ